MSKAGKRLTADTVAAVQSATGVVVKGPALADILSPLCEAATGSKINKRLDKLARMVESLSAPAPRRQSLGLGHMPYVPDQWHMAPKFPPRTINGYGGSGGQEN